jgi:DNA polymerase-3 subunit gamma/tau
MSDHYKVTALKWRPQRFDEVVGQDHITRTLKNAIRENRLAHAYLFTGQRGCGKTTVARILAKAINCPNAAANDYEPCNKCEICLAITNGSSMDVAEIDGASNNGVDDVREMRENVKYPPLNGKYRIVIIDEVHMLSTAAFNALLKTLEEPPRHLVFIFATTEVQKLLPTILSRTQRFDFRRMQIDEIVKHLKHIAEADKIEYDDDALLVIAKKADGSMRDGQSIFDQAVAFSGNSVRSERLREALNLIDADFYFDVSDAIANADPGKAFSLAQEVSSRGYDVEEFIGGVLEHLRNFLTVLVTRKRELLEVSKEHQKRYEEGSRNFSEADILRLVRIGYRALQQLRDAPSPKMVLELMLTEMTLAEKAIDIRALLEEIQALRNGAPAASKLSAPAPAQKKTPISSPAPEIPRPEAVSAPAPASAPVTNGAIGSKWREFLEFASERSIPFRLVMEDVELTDASGPKLVLGISKNHSAETFARNHDTFQKLLREFFASASLDFETKRIERKAPERHNSGRNASSNGALASSENGSAAITFDDDAELSDLERALMKDLGATPV